jgi:hypothetical protein
MKPTVYLRAAAVLTLLTGIGHTLGKPWIPAKDPLTAAVTAAMQSHRVHVMGFDRTLMEFYVGFGLIIGVNLFLQALLLWMTADLAAREPGRARAIATVFFFANIAGTVVAAVYLFTVPLVLSAMTALLLGIGVLMPWKGLTARG